MNHTTWVLVADSCKAKIFKTIKAKLFNGSVNGNELTLINEFTHEAGTKRDQDLVSDRQGKFGSGTFVEPTDPKKHENDLFAANLAKQLLLNHQLNQYNDLILIAPPAFIGMIHKHLPHEIKKIVSTEIEKDYTRESEKDLINHLKNYL